MDGVNEGMFPGFWDDVGDETGVDYMEKDMTDGVECQLEDPNAKSVSSTGWRIFHGTDDVVEGTDGDRMEVKCASTHSGQSLR